MSRPPNDTQKSLHAWLSTSKPKPARVRLYDDEGQESFIDITSQTKWKTVCETVVSSGMTRIQCLDGKNTVLRGELLSVFGVGGDESVGEDRREAASFRGMANVVDAIARNHNEAFDRGAQAASAATDSLIEIVQTLTGNLNIAITNLHNMAANLANILQGKDPEDGQMNPNNDLLVRVLGAAAARALNAGAPPAGEPNGKPKGKAP